MKRIIPILLSLAFMFTMIPSTASAIGSNGTVLNKLKLSDVKTYDKALPTKGVKKTQKQIEALRKKIPFNENESYNTDYSYSLQFYRSAEQSRGKYEYVMKTSDWARYNSKTKFTSLLSKSYVLMSNDEDLHKKTSFILRLEDKKYYYNYSWIKNQKKGEMKKTKKSDVIKKTNYKLYPDATVLGQKCMVYSYDYGKGDSKSTSYVYVSRKNGVEAKSVSVNKYGTYTYICFQYKRFNKAASYFKKPKGVKFTTVK